MSGAEKTKIIVLEPVTKSVGELLKVIEQKGLAEIERVSNPAEVTQIALQFQPCVIFICMTSPADVPSRVNMIKGLENGIKYGQFKILFASNTKNKQVGNLITSLGITDYMEEPIPLRTLQFKVNIQIKAIDTIKKNLAAKKLAQEKVVFKKAEEKVAIGGETAPLKVKPALGFREDFFLFKNSQPKRLGKKYTIEAEGPDPSTGEWVRHESKGDDQPAWRWVPSDEKNQSADKQKNGWIHKGDKPQFSEQSQKWQFISEQPSLNFVKDDKVVASKLSTNEKGEIEVAEDSIEAEENVKKNRTAARVEKMAKETLKKISKPGEVNENQENSEGLKESEKGPVFRNLLKKSEAGTEFEISENSEAKDSKDPSKHKFTNKTGGLRDSGPNFNNKIGTAPEGSAGDRGNSTKSSGTETESADHQAQALKTKIEGEDPQVKWNGIERFNLSSPSAEEEAKGSSDPQKELSKEEQALNSRLKMLGKEGKKGKFGATNGENESEEKSGVGKLKSILGNSRNATQRSLKSPFGRGDGEQIEFGAGEEDSTQNADGSLKESNVFNNHTLKNIGKAKDAKNPFGLSHLAQPGKLNAKQVLEKKRLEAAIRKMEKGEKVPLSPGELVEAKKSLGLGEKDEVDPQELARKAIDIKLARMKEKLLANFGDAVERNEDSGQINNLIDQDSKEKESTWSQGGIKVQNPNSELGKRRVIDNEEEILGTEEEKRLNKLRNIERKQRERMGDNHFYLPKEKLLPLEGAWERAGDFSVYLSSEVKYRGYNLLEEILPLWVFSGSGLPSFINKTEEWKFRDRFPDSISKEADLPPDVVHFLTELKARTKVNAEAKAARKIEAKKDTRSEEERSKSDAFDSALAKQKNKLKLVEEDPKSIDKVPEKLKSKLESLKSKIKSQREDTLGSEELQDEPSGIETIEESETADDNINSTAAENTELGREEFDNASEAGGETRKDREAKRKEELKKSIKEKIAAAKGKLSFEKKEINNETGEIEDSVSDDSLNALTEEISDIESEIDASVTAESTIGEETPDSKVDEAAAEELATSATKRKPNVDNNEKIAALKNKLLETEESGSLEISEEATPEEEKAQNEDSEVLNLEAEGDSILSQENLEEELGDKKKKRRIENESQLDSLKKRLEESIQDGEEASLHNDVITESERENPSSTEVDSNANNEVSKKPSEQETPGGIAERLAKKSPGLEQFFEKRKKRLEEGGDSVDDVKSALSQAASLQLGKNNGYLGVLVAISNSLGISKNYPKKIRRLLATLADALSEVEFFVVDNLGEGVLRLELSATGKDEQTSWTRGNESDKFDIPYPIGLELNNQRSLEWRFSGQRSSLSETELAIVQKVATAIGTILSQEKTNADIGKEAA